MFFIWSLPDADLGWFAATAGPTVWLGRRRRT
jgi:hypothetical protein